MQQLFRFIQRVTSAVTPTFNSLITVGDTVPTVFSKLQALLGIRSLRTVLVSTYTGGASTTADQNIMSLVVPASYNQIGNVFLVKMYGIWSKPFSIGTTIDIWVKINGVKVLDLSYNTPTGTATNFPFNFEAMVINRTLGTSGVFAVNGRVEYSTNATTGLDVIDSGEFTTTADTNADVTITVGYDFSNSNASNNVQVHLGTIIMG